MWDLAQIIGTELVVIDVSPKLARASGRSGSVRSTIRSARGARCRVSDAIRAIGNPQKLAHLNH
jgi:hypothetical protein